MLVVLVWYGGERGAMRGGRGAAWCGVARGDDLRGSPTRSCNYRNGLNSPPTQFSLGYIDFHPPTGATRTTFTLEARALLIFVK